MLSYKLHKTDGDLAFYHYYPDGNGATGVVSIDKTTGKTEIVAQSEDDFGNRYASKLIKRLQEFFASKTYEETGTIAWY